MQSSLTSIRADFHCIPYMSQAQFLYCSGRGNWVLWIHPFCQGGVRRASAILYQCWPWVIPSRSISRINYFGLSAELQQLINLRWYEEFQTVEALSCDQSFKTETKILMWFFRLWSMCTDAMTHRPLNVWMFYLCTKSQFLTHFCSLISAVYEDINVFYPKCLNVRL